MVKPTGEDESLVGFFMLITVIYMTCVPKSNEMGLSGC